MGLELTLENVLVRLDQMEVMTRFFGEPVIIGKQYKNPFRKDTNPGCFFKKSNGVLVFCDFGSPYWGDCISICSYRLGTGLYPALQYLNKEYNLGLGYDDCEIMMPSSPVINTEYSKDTVKEAAKIVYQRYEDFTEDNYFSQYHITKSTLERYNVIPIHKVWVGTQNRTEIFKSSETQPIYIYDFGLGDYKVYRPNSKQETKWRTNCKRLQGFTELTDRLVIRTSSLKDVMVLHECGYLADAPHCENHCDFTRENMLLLYDNDETGKKYSIIHSKHYNCPYILLPETYKDGKLLKDPSDLAKAFGLDYLKTLLKQLISNAYSGRILLGT